MYDFFDSQIKKYFLQNPFDSSILTTVNILWRTFTGCIVLILAFNIKGELWKSSSGLFIFLLWDSRWLFGRLFPDRKKKRIINSECRSDQVVVYGATGD